MWLGIVRSYSSCSSSASLFFPDPEQNYAIWLLLKAIRNGNEVTGNTTPATSHEARNLVLHLFIKTICFIAN